MRIEQVTGRPVTAHEQACWDALHEHKSTTKAGMALGKAAAAVRAGVLSYMAKQGITGPIPYTFPRNASRARDLHEVRAENARLHRRVAELEARVQELEGGPNPWLSVHKKLDALLARPAGVTAITHRRIKDGGVGGKQERKARRTA